jgi:hypothetical protein
VLFQIIAEKKIMLSSAWDYMGKVVSTNLQHKTIHSAILYSPVVTFNFAAHLIITKVCPLKYQRQIFVVISRVQPALKGTWIIQTLLSA